MYLSGLMSSELLGPLHRNGFSNLDELVKVNPPVAETGDRMRVRPRLARRRYPEPAAAARGGDRYQTREGNPRGGSKSVGAADLHESRSFIRITTGQTQSDEKGAKEGELHGVVF